MVAVIEINTELGRVLATVDHIVERRGNRKREQWADLQDDIEALGVIVDNYSDLYVKLLIEIQYAMGDPVEAEEASRDLARVAKEFLNDDRLLNRLFELRGSVQAASHFKGLERRHRELATDLRDLERATTAFIEFAEDVRSGKQQQDSGGERLWNLWDVMNCLQGEDVGLGIRELCEEAIRNRRPFLTRSVHGVGGKVRREIGFEFLQ